MTGLAEVSEAVVERLKPVLPTWETFWFTPVNDHPLPALCLRPDDGQFAGYQESLGSYTKWYLRAGLYVVADEEETAHRRLSELTDPDGPLITRFLDEDIEDALSELCGLYRAVTDGRRWKPERLRRRLSCDIGLVCGTN